MKKLVVALVLVAPFALAQKKQLQPGQWQITVQMEMEGSPVRMQPMTMTKCVTPDQAKSPAELFRPRNPNAKDDCEMKEVKQEGNKFSWTVDCKGKGKGSGSVTFEPGKYDGVAVMEVVDRKGVLRKMTSTMSGRRIGECAQ
jgi:hypothetical protein